MGSPGNTGTSSGSSSLQQNSSSELDQEMQMQIMDERKRKRMQSNRESAKRSRMRKQKHLDDLTAQVTQLRKTNHQILNHIKLSTQQYLKIEGDNSVLKAQMSELSNRLISLNQMTNALGVFSNHYNHDYNHNPSFYDHQGEDLLHHVIQQPIDQSDLFLMTSFNQSIMASANMFQCS